MPMKLSTLALPSLVLAAGEQNITTAAGTATGTASVVTETLTTVNTITSCKDGCTKGEVPSTWTSLVTLTTTYCPDSSDSSAPIPASSDVDSTLTYTSVQTITTCSGGCDKPGASTETKEITESITTFPKASATPTAPGRKESTSSSKESTKSPQVPTNSPKESSKSPKESSTVPAPAPSPDSTTTDTLTSTITYTTVETLTTCEGGCDKPGASTQTREVTKVVTTCPPEESSATPAPPATKSASVEEGTSTITYTNVETYTTCEGGCDKPGATTETRVTTKVITSCATNTEAPTPTQPAEVTSDASVVPNNGAGVVGAAFGLVAVAMIL